jgi:hypothetical protein
VDQSSRLRTERSQVQVLHAAPLRHSRDSLSSSSWQGRLPLKEMTGVRIPVRAPRMFPSSSSVQDAALSRRKQGFESPREHQTMVALAQQVRAPGCELGGRGFEPHTSPTLMVAICDWRVAQRQSAAPTRQKPAVRSRPRQPPVDAPGLIPMLRNDDSVRVRGRVDSGIRVLSGLTRVRILPDAPNFRRDSSAGRAAAS